jgi:sodium-dependent phosphate transporter
VFSAICVIFAHGAGEVGFMAGPLSAIYDIYMTGVLHKSVQSQLWCVMLGAASLVIGLATYGYNVTRSMGTMMAKLTPSRGFAAELATALVILVASQLGLPTSSSQCITGGIVGVGLMEGVMAGVNWKHFAKQFASWVSTLFTVGLGVAAVFAQVRVQLY